MNKVITHEQIEKLEKYIDERKEIVETYMSPVDKAYFYGMIKAIELLGFDCISYNGIHKIF